MSYTLMDNASLGIIAGAFFVLGFGYNYAVRELVKWYRGRFAQ